MALENAPTKTWELNTYEINRRPQEAITDNTLVAVSPRSLQSELMCPICLDILKSTMTTKECLHRFCQVCITTALRSGNKECPTCRKKLVSKRSLRADPNFDSLIAKIFPHREEYEAAQEKALERISRQCSAPAACPTTTASNAPATTTLTTVESCPAPVTTTAPSLSSISSPVESRPSFPLHSDAESSCEDLLTGTLNCRSRVNSEAGSAVETNSIGGSSSIFSLDPTPQHNHQLAPTSSTSGRLPETSIPPSVHEPTEIELVMRPYPENASSTRRYVGKGEQAKYLRCPSSTTVGHLCQYLAIRGEESAGTSESSHSIYYVSDKGQHTELNPNLSLRDVSDEHWLGSGRFQLFYNSVSKVIKKST